MQEEKSESVKNFIRGGQILQHNMRMWTQIMKKIMLACVGSFLLLNMIWFVCVNTPYHRYVTLQWLSANFWILFDAKHTQPFLEPSGQTYHVYAKDVVNSPEILAIVRDVKSHAMMGLIYTAAVQLIIFQLGLVWLRRSGKTKTENKQKAGDLVVSNKELVKIIKKRDQDSDLVLAGVPLIRNKECQHFLFDGTTGAGKSTAIKYLMDQIRARGDKAIIYDKGCSLIQEFYQPTDVLLNPLDIRGAKWHLWNECRDSVDYDNIAVALIPRSPNASDPFWVDAARAVFSATAFGMSQDDNKSATKLLKYLLTTELENIKHYLEGTFAETLASDKIEKTAISIRAVLATYLKCLKYVDDDPKGFCVRDWIRDETQDNWLFITSLGDRHETLKPLMTAWLDIAVNSLISLTHNRQRRVWFILDEMSSLHVLPSLEGGLAESRKFGGCFVLGWQNISQLRRVYGHDGARSLSALTNTRFMYRQPDPDIAKWSASNLGESIIDEVREGISYGANSMRDGVSISRAEIRKPVISYSEIMNLDDLNCYLRLPGAYPLTKLKFLYHERNKTHEPFIMRPIDEKKTREVDGLIKKYEKPLVDAYKQETDEKSNKKKRPKGQQDVLESEEYIYQHMV